MFFQTGGGGTFYIAINRPLLVPAKTYFHLRIQLECQKGKIVGMTQVKLQRSFLAKVLKLFFLLQNICECWKTNGGRYQMCEGKTFEGSFQRVI